MNLPQLLPQFRRPPVAEAATEYAESCKSFEAIVPSLAAASHATRDGTLQDAARFAGRSGFNGGQSKCAVQMHQKMQSGYDSRSTGARMPEFRALNVRIYRNLATVQLRTGGDALTQRPIYCISALFIPLAD